MRSKGRENLTNPKEKKSFPLLLPTCSFLLNPFKAAHKNTNNKDSYQSPQSWNHLTVIHFY